MARTYLGSQSGSIASALNAGLLMLLLCLVLGFVVAFDVGAKADRMWLVALAFRANSTPDGVIAIAQWISWLGDPAQRSVIMIGFAVLLATRRQWGAIVVMLVVPIVGAATSTILKEAFARARPDAVPHLAIVENLSYPSGHAAGAAALFVTAALLCGASRPRTAMFAALIVALVTGVTRIVLGVHYPSDVVGGWLWGGGWALVGVALAKGYGVKIK